MTTLFRSAMDFVYLVCAVLACAALVLISAVVPWGVFTRYVLNSSASWPEPAAILLSIVLTFFGAAACFRASVHMRVSFVRQSLPPALGWLADILANLIMLAMGVFMTGYGKTLCETTWNQSIAEFPALSVGVTYLPIPLGGLCLSLFVIERLLMGAPADTLGDAHGAVTSD